MSFRIYSNTSYDYVSHAETKTNFFKVVRAPQAEDPVTSPMTVHYTVSGTGTSEVDLVSGSIVIPADEYGAKIDFNAINPPTPTADRTVTITIDADPAYDVVVESTVSFTVLDDLPQQAFPTAMGAASHSKGGRGGDVYHVTNLNDSGAGSLRDAVSVGNRTVVFDVSGEIVTTSDITITESFITVVGQTAPQGGITVSGSRFKLNYPSTDVIIRYIRFKQDRTNGGLSSTLFGAYSAKNLILDHCSFAYGRDETILIWDAVKPCGAHTIQNCIIAEGKTGVILGSGVDTHRKEYANNYTFANNLIRDMHRTPNIAGSGKYEIVNNLVYNWQIRLSSVYNESEITHVNNWYESNFVSEAQPPTVNGDYFNKTGASSFFGQIYTDGNNYKDFTVADDWDAWFIFATATPSDEVAFRTNILFDSLGTYPITTLTAVEGRNKILSSVGADSYLNSDGTIGKWVDENDTLYISDALNGTDSFGVLDGSKGNAPRWYAVEPSLVLNFPIIPENTRPGVNGEPGTFYVSNAHIPEDYLTIKGLPQNATVHNDLNADGYTILEQFINEVDINVFEGEELYTVANALARGVNEANATTGITQGGTTATSAISPTPQDGSYLIVVSGSIGQVNESITLTAGKSYIIKYWAWTEASSSGYSAAWVGTTGNTTDTFTTTPTEYTQTIVPTSGSITMRWYINGGTEVYVDGLSIKEVQIPVTGVTVTPSTASVGIGTKVGLSRQIIPSDAQNQNGTWSSSNDSLAIVNSTGEVTGVALGDVVITYTTEQGGFIDTTAVNISADIVASLKAFPEAEGYGKNTIGGRGGQTIYVTSLADSGTGTLREAINTVGARTILFKVGGLITVTSPLYINNPNISILGQSAPGDGIILSAEGTPNIQVLTVATDEVIIRYLKVRRSSVQVSEASSDGIYIASGNNIIVDHCSMSQASDENLSIADYSEIGTTNITIQNCLISYPYGGSSKGSLNVSAINRITYFRNVFVSNRIRNPEFSCQEFCPDNDTYFEIINNAIFDAKYWISADRGVTPALGVPKYNIINNYSQLNTSTNTERQMIMSLTDEPMELYIEGNISNVRSVQTLPIDWDEEWSMTQGADGVGNLGVVSNVNNQVITPHLTPIIEDSTILYNPTDILTNISSHVGASYPSRDSIDDTAISTFQAGVALSWSAVDLAIPVYDNASNNTPSYIDTNNDGIDDAWFTANVPNGDTATSTNVTGYTYLEVYQNSLVGSIPPTSIDVTGVTIDIATNVEVNGTLQLTTTFAPTNATNKNGVWSIDTETFATINPTTGVVTGVAEGISLITFTTSDGGFEDTINITTIAEVIRPVIGVSVTPATATVAITNTQQLELIFDPTNATDQSGVWSSSNETVATVDQNGFVTTLAEGVATITFISTDGPFSDTSEITVSIDTTPTSIEFIGSGALGYSYAIAFDEGTVNPLATFVPFDSNLNATFTYSIPEPNQYDYLLFSVVNGNQLQLNITPDYENPVDTAGNNIYALNVRVTNNFGNFFDQFMMFVIEDVGDILTPSQKLKNKVTKVRAVKRKNI